MRYSVFVCVFGMFAAAAFGQQAKPNFSGSWRLVADKSQVHPGRASVVAMTIEQKDSSIHVKKTIKGLDGNESTTEFTCAMDGNDCDAGGFKVNLFFDGRALVEMDFSDKTMSKTIMTLDDNNTICASVTYVAPKGEADTFTFDKM